MYELIRVSDTCCYMEAPAKVGFVLGEDGRAYLIDSGNDKDAGKKILRHLQANGWELAAICNTHSHADHIGGNQYLQQQTGCQIFASGIEADFTKHPVLEPAFLYGGYPPRDLQHKFLMAKESRVELLEEAALPMPFTVVPMPGHSFDMVGFRTKDDVVFAADALSTKETLDKYAIGFLYDVGAYLQTLEALKNTSAKLFVPSHAPATENIAPLAQYNIDRVLSVADTVASLCSEPISFEVLLQKLFDRYQLAMNFTQYALVGSTVRSYLSWLSEKGAVEAFVQDNLLLWKRKV